MDCTNFYDPDVAHNQYVLSTLLGKSYQMEVIEYADCKRKFP